MVVILSIFIEYVPNEITDYEDYNGYPIKVTEAEASNETLLEMLKKVSGSKVYRGKVSGSKVRR